MKILIVTEKTFEIGTEASPSEVIGITELVAESDIVMTQSGKLLKDRDGNTEVVID